MLRTSSFAIVLALVTTSFAAHVSLLPSFGAHAGKEFTTVLELPPAPASLWTSKVVLTIPSGVAEVQAEAVSGWTVESRELHAADNPPEELLLSSRSSKALVFQATGSSGSPTLRFTLKLRLGCDYSSPFDATVWLGQHTLWWRTVQYFSKAGSTDAAEPLYRLWSKLPESAEALWEAPGSFKEEGPCPYMFVSPDTACAAAAHEGNAEPNGMMWLGSAVPAPSGASEGEGAMLSKLVQESLNKEESLETRIETSSKSGHSVDRHGRVGGRHKPDGIMDDDEDLSDDNGSPSASAREQHINRRDSMLLVKLIFFIFMGMVTLGGAYAIFAKAVFWLTRKLFPGVRYRQPEDAAKKVQKPASPPTSTRENESRACELGFDVEAACDASTQAAVMGAPIQH